MTVDSSGDGSWGDNDPSVFIVMRTWNLRGEFQVTNDYGPVLAPLVMKVRFC